MCIYIYCVDCAKDLVNWFVFLIIFMLTSRKIGNWQNIKKQNFSHVYVIRGKCNLDKLQIFFEATCVWQVKLMVYDESFTLLR